MADSEGRILVTLDKDFGELVIVHHRPHHGILRVVDISAKKQAGVIQHVLTLRRRGVAGRRRDHRGEGAPENQATREEGRRVVISESRTHSTERRKTTPRERRGRPR